MPASAPPIIMPTMPVARTGANALRVSDQSRIIAGTEMPSSWLSMPSNTIVIAVSSTNSFCRLPHDPSSSSRAMSIDFTVGLFHDRRLVHHG